jgi:streptogramin lyase
MGVFGIRKRLRGVALLLAAMIPVLGLAVSTPVVAQATPGIAEFPVPLAGDDLSAIATGPDGNMWFVEQHGRVGKITSSGAVTEYTLPGYTTSGFGPVPENITAGSDGNMWFTEAAAGDIGRITPAGSVTLYPSTSNNVPTGPDSIALGNDGAVWFAEDGQLGDSIGKITASGAVTQYSLPEGKGVQHVAVGPDGNIWFSTSTANPTTGAFIAAYFGEITPQGVVTEYEIPDQSVPEDFATGPDGNIWFIDNTGYPGQIAKYVPSSGAITAYPVPTSGAELDSLANGPDGNIWFTESNEDNVGEITTLGAVTEYAVPTPSARPDAIAAGPDGNMWFTEAGANKIGELLLAQPPSAPTNLTAQSPTATPALSWDAVAGATSYNIYRDGTLIGSSDIPAFTDTTATAGPYDYYVTAVNAYGESGPSNTVTVQVGQSPAITSAGSASTGMRAPFSFTVTTTGTPTAALSEVGALPAGITFTDNGDGTATIAGQAPTGTAGAYPITITASNGLSPDATQSFTLTVDSQSAAPAITSANNDTETVGVPFSFTVTTNGYPAPALTLSRRGALPKDITFTDNGDGTATIASAGPAASDAGAYAFIMTAANGILPQASQTFTLTVTETPVLKGIPATKTASAGSAFTMKITSKANPVASLSESGALPDGLTFTDNGDGTATIAGVPQPDSPGAYPITITATNPLGATSQTFTLNVDSPPVITSDDGAAAIAGTPFSFTLTAAGFPSPSFKKTGTLPRGITWHAATGTLSGTPAASSAGTYPITFTATNSSGTVSQTFTLTVTSSG